MDGISFEVRAGERVGLVGESGAGKSLTALALPKLLPRGVEIVAGSSVQLGRTDVLGASESELRRIRGGRLALVLQDSSNALTPARTIGSQLVEVLRLHHGLGRAEARDQALALLTDVGLPDAERIYAEVPHRLSGGMRQRSCIALGLAGAPDFLIVDEPTTALDVTVQARILRLLVRLSEERRLGVLLVSHDLAVVAQTCHRVLVLYAGQVVESGPVERVLADPRLPYTRALLDARPRLTGVRTTPSPIPGSVPQPSDWPSGCRFHPRCASRMDRCASVAPNDRETSVGRVRCWLTREEEPRA